MKYWDICLVLTPWKQLRIVLSTSTELNSLPQQLGSTREKKPPVSCYKMEKYVATSIGRLAVVLIATESQVLVSETE